MLIFDPVKTGAPRRTDAGARMWHCPTYPTAPARLGPAGCRGCSKDTEHNVTENLIDDVPWGVHRYSRIPIAERQDAGGMQRLSAALWLWDYVLRGMIGNEWIYNAGSGADNASQTWEYEIVAAGIDEETGAGYLDLDGGQDPRNLTTGASRVNPAYPGPDPITGGYGRLVTSSLSGCLMPGAASVEFLWPSSLAGKWFPLITRITPPVTPATQWRAWFDDGADPSNAIQPLDLMFPPADGVYRCRVRMEFIHASIWRDYQAPDETQWAPRSMTFTTAAIYGLLDSGGNPCRILLPSIAAGAAGVVTDCTEVVDLTTRLTTEPFGGLWRTWLDLTGLTFTRLTIHYWAEATAADEVRVPGMGHCVYAKRDPSGSYSHEAGGQHCAHVESSGFQAGEFHQNCWLPGRCDLFAVLDESPATMGDHQFLSDLWTRAGWLLRQGMPGSSSHRNFMLDQVGGASIQGLCGSFLDSVPGGFFPQVAEWGGNPLGERATYLEPDGDTWQNLILGAFYQRLYSPAGTSASSYIPDAWATLRLGTVARQVADWESGKTAPLSGFPWRYVGHTGVYDFVSAGSSMACDNTPAASESYLVATSPTQTPEPEVVERMRALYP